MIGEICKSPNIENLLKLKIENNPKVYVEIGVLYGGSIIKLMEDPQECFYVGIDPFTGYYGSEYDPHRGVNLKDHINIVKKNIDENNPHNHKYHLIKGNSESEEVLKQFKELNIKIDHLFIDGDHSAAAVKRDFYNYLPFMNKGGLILFDNYDDPSWTEVKPATDEIIEECSEIELLPEATEGHLCVVRVV
jgi:predicted O-methyltransferase YrrM